jgi:hypothetical protein
MKPITNRPPGLSTPARFGFTYIAERLYLSEIGNHLVVSHPGAILIIKRFIECMYLLCQCVHGRLSMVLDAEIDFDQP